MAGRGGRRSTHARAASAWMVVVASLLLLMSAGCTGGPADDGRGGDGTTTLPASAKGGSELARRTRERAASITSTRVVAGTTYPAGVDCRAWGDEAVEALVTSDGTTGWVDVDRDGSRDALRDGDRILVSSRLVPDWSSPTDWISVPPDRTDLVASTALLAGPLRWALGPFFERPGQGDSIGQLEQTIGAAQAQGHETVNGRETTRYELGPGAAPGVTAAAWVADDGVVARLQVSNTQDPFGSSGQLVDVVAIDEPVDVDLPDEGSVTPVGRLAAAPVILARASLDLACTAPETSAETTALRACIEQAAQGQTLEAFFGSGEPGRDLYGDCPVP